MQLQEKVPEEKQQGAMLKKSKKIVKDKPKKEDKKKLNGQPLASTEKVSCKFCGKTYTNKYSMHTHLKTLHKVKPHECEVCQEGFWEIKDLKNHMESLHLSYLVEQCRQEKIKNDQEMIKLNLQKQQQEQQQQIQDECDMYINLDCNENKQQQEIKQECQFNQLLQYQCDSSASTSKDDSCGLYVNQVSESQYDMSQNMDIIFDI